MKKPNIIFSIIAFVCMSCPLFAQSIVNDTICVALDESIVHNVTFNDTDPFGPGSNAIPFLLGQNDECFLLEDGQVIFIGMGNEMCCGEFILEYSYMFSDGTSYQGEPGLIYITVKCPKPECGIVDLDEIREDPAAGNGKLNLYSCEHSTSTYFTEDVPGYTYTWTITGGTNLTVGNSSIIDILWGPMGSGIITLDIFNGITTVTKIFCVDILEGPVAAFMPLTNCACLNSPIAFQNNSIGGSSYYWDFGDGNFSNSYEPTHNYSSPGVYEVTLVVTKENYDEFGNALCCCTDSFSMEIEIDPRPGPDILWVSTLCPGDSTKYWTTATGCTYNWTVEEADGTLLTFDGQGNDTICVNWNDGPYGIVSLQVTGCPSLCDKPVSALIPIVSSIEDIEGETIVCEFSTHNYELPKWPTVEYTWTATGSTNIQGNGGHNVDITWGPAGPGTIHVDYCSDFLGGLPGHEDEDCCGMADLNVNIKPEYFLDSIHQSPVCVGDTSTYFTSEPSNSFNWTVTPAATIIGNGTYSVEIIWPSSGTYQVLVHPLGLNPFCNDTLYAYMNVIEIDQVDSISGKMAVCMDDVELYFAHSDDLGVGFEWDVSGGTPTNFTGNPITVTWDSPGPYELCVKQFQLDDPECVSDTICKQVALKTIDLPLTLTGPPGCVNSVKTYTLGPAQTYDVTYEWMIMDPEDGSVISSPDSNVVDIQWNDLPGTTLLTAKVTLCGITDSITIPIVIYPEPGASITQIGYLCPGVSALLDAGVSGGGVSYNWSPGSGTTQIISISSPGLYSVTVTDGNGCTDIDTYEAFNIDGPDAGISSPDHNVICNDSGASTTLHTLDNPDYNFQWYCNGFLQITPPSQAFFTHGDSLVTGTWTYYVVVTDIITGCITVSDNFYVYQSPCTGGGTGSACDPVDYDFSASNINQVPWCNTVDFDTLSVSNNVTVTGWKYGDGDVGGAGATIHTFTEAKYYIATVTGTVPSNNGGTCPVSATTSVCIPLAADFDYSIECNMVTFTNYSTYLTGHSISSYLWTFGTYGSSVNENPMFTFPVGGSHLVTLKVTDITGCMATISFLINIYSDPTPTINVSPAVVCVEDDVAFSVSTTGVIIDYMWDFGDFSTNGGATPSHSYLSNGTYNVSVTVTDENGCTGVGTNSVLVHPKPIEGPIVITPADIVCDGESITLTASGGVLYEWSDGFTGNPNVVYVSGIYDVTVTDVNGCDYVADPVDVTVLPPLDATIVGDSVICETGCVNISAPAGYNYMYQWKDGGGGTIAGQTGQSISVCHYSTYSSVQVMITDDNGCMATSNTINVSVELKPIVGISVVGDYCAGSPNILTANPILPDVVYYWSDGTIGTTTTTYIAGTHTLFGRDTITGCVGTDVITINPIPDLCIVPTGCYDVCAPDTICGPPGMLTYQWNMDGLPMPGENDDCLIIEESGSYSLTAENSFHCFNTSDTLILNVVPCCEEQTELTSLHTTTSGDTCCYSLSYYNSMNLAQFLVITLEDGYFTSDSGLDSDFSGAITGPAYVLNNSTAGNLPIGTYPNFVEVCVKSNMSPQTVSVIYSNDALATDTICVDSLIFDCVLEPDCLYMVEDSIYCLDDQVYYDFTVCNPVDADFDIGYINFQTFAPAGVIINPPGINLTGSPLLPGDCDTYTVEVNGSGITNEQMCFNLIGHFADPIDDPAALCCSLDTMYYIQIPGCDPCDSVYVQDVSVVMNGDSCCYDITVVNNLDDMLFDGVDVCVLTTGSTVIPGALATNVWYVEETTPVVTKFSLVESTIDPNSKLKYGPSTLPELCVAASEFAVTLVELKWMDGDLVICRDTLELICNNDCGGMVDYVVNCDGSGGWNVQLYIQNTSGQTMETAYIQFDDVGLEIYNTSVALGSLPPLGIYGPININIGAPAVGGSTLNITVVLHSLGHNDDHTECCEFPAQVPLPICDGEPSCVCDDDFEFQVSLGAVITSITGSEATIEPVGNFSDCDMVMWLWTYQAFPKSNLTVGNNPVVHTFPTADGEYSYVMVVIRTMSDGTQCEFEFVGEFEMIGEPEPYYDPYPNPVFNMLQIEYKVETAEDKLEIKLFNLAGKHVTDLVKIDDNSRMINIDVENIDEGMYLMYITQKSNTWLEKIIVIK